MYSSKETTFETIRESNFYAPYDTSFLQGAEQVLWLKFNVVNTDSNTSEYFLYSKEAYFAVFQETDTGWTVFKNGFLTPVAERPKVRNPGFLKVSLPVNRTSEIYVRLQAGNYSSPYHRPVIGGKMFHYRQQELDAAYNLPGYTFSLIYLSSLIMITFFVLILFVSIREKIYVYYLLYLLFQILYSLIVFSHNPMISWDITNTNPTLGYLLMEGVQFTFIGFYIFFIIELIEIQKFDSLLAQIMRGFAWFCFGYAIFSICFTYFSPDSHTHFLIFKYVRMFVLPLNLVLIIWVIQKVQHPLVTYFIIGNIFFFSGSVLSVYASLNGINLDPNSLIYFDNSLNTIFQMGLLCEVFCFSFAIAHHVRLIYNEKKENSAAFIRQLEENQRIQENMNKELDKKINAKTTELIEVYSAIEKQREKEIKNAFSQKIKETEMLALRSQMNPHFLFNSMNAIKHLILTERSKDAMDYLDDFASLLRGVLQNSKRESITVEDELELLELYLSLEKGRLGPTLQYEIITADRAELSQYPIPALLLQPFVENAIWHGLQPKKDEKKNLDITFDTTNELVITIRDNGIGRKAADELKGKKSLHKSFGIEITRERLSLFNHLNEFKIDLKITDLENNGLSTGTLVIFTYSI